MFCNNDDRQQVAVCCVVLGRGVTGANEIQEAKFYGVSVKPPAPVCPITHLLAAIRPHMPQDTLPPTWKLWLYTALLESIRPSFFWENLVDFNEAQCLRRLNLHTHV